MVYFYKYAISPAAHFQKDPLLQTPYCAGTGVNQNSNHLCSRTRAELHAQGRRQPTRSAVSWVLMEEGGTRPVLPKIIVPLVPQFSVTPDTWPILPVHPPQGLPTMPALSLPPAHAMTMDVLSIHTRSIDMKSQLCDLLCCRVIAFKICLDPMRETHPCVPRVHSLDPWEALEQIKKQDPQDRDNPGYLTSSHSRCSLGVFVPGSPEHKF